MLHVHEFQPLIERGKCGASPRVRLLLCVFVCVVWLLACCVVFCVVSFGCLAFAAASVLKRICLHEGD